MVMKILFGDASYRGIERRDEMEGKDIDWCIAKRSGKVKALRKRSRINKVVLKPNI
jgi:IS5 family transposase